MRFRQSSISFLLALSIAYISLWLVNVWFLERTILSPSTLKVKVQQQQQQQEQEQRAKDDFLILKKGSSSNNNNSSSSSSSSSGSDCILPLFKENEDAKNPPIVMHGDKRMEYHELPFTSPHHHHHQPPTRLVAGGENRAVDSAYLTMYGDHVAKESFAMLPSWLKEYILWNRRNMRNNNCARMRNNTTNVECEGDHVEDHVKYLVMTCLPKDSQCGGLSDRLRILPFYLLAANMTSRRLCIYWKRPFPLEEYLQPTAHGIPWSCPPHFAKFIDDSKSSARQKRRKTKHIIDFHPWHRCHDVPLIPCTEEGIRKIQTSSTKYIIMDMDSHSYHHINHMNLFFQRHSYVKDENHYYSNKDGIPNLQHWSYPQHMNHIFRVLFKPVQSLAQKINTTMSILGLVENEYISVHVRSRYPVEDVALVHERIDPIDKEGQLDFECDDDDGGDGPRCICTNLGSNHSLTTTKYLVEVVTNAIQCGSSLFPSSQEILSNKIYFASDHHNVRLFFLFDYLQSSYMHLTYFIALPI